MQWSSYTTRLGSTLPSVGAGEVLRDMLTASDVISRVMLTKIFRQAQDSGVITNAHCINSGKFPETTGLKDFFWFAEDDNEKVAELTVDVVARRLPKKFGLDPSRDVQVLTPKTAGPTGSSVLNGALQEAITPQRPNVAERRFGGRVFRVGDKVIQIRNNYEKGAAGVFNTRPSGRKGPFTRDYFATKVLTGLSGSVPSVFKRAERGALAKTQIPRRAPNAEPSRLLCKTPRQRDLGDLCVSGDDRDDNHSRLCQQRQQCK